MQLDVVIIHFFNILHAAQVGHQAQHRRANIFIQPFAHGEQDIIGGVEMKL